MNVFKASGLAIGCVMALGFWGLARPASPETDTSVREFRFNYIARIPAAPPSGKLLKIWIPLPQSDSYQEIGSVKVESSLPYANRRDSEYGNQYLYFEVPAGQGIASGEVRLAFQVSRREHRVSFDGNTPGALRLGSDPPSLQRFLKPDQRVPLQGVIADLSAEQTRGIQEPLAKARAIYDYVLANMRYDKSGTGWGNGDAVWACTSKRGNCTDFHSLFIGMMRSAGIPARFEIGFPLPAEKHEGDIPGYHCWAEFYLERYGWIPVDASEAWKHPEKREYFFGAHDTNRVQFTVGRDIRLEPPQQGAPLNYFIYPYAELDGAPFPLESKFSFEDRRGERN